MFYLFYVKYKCSKICANFVLMKYLVRSLQYFIYLLVILTLVISILMAAGFAEKDLSQTFVNGYDSLWQIALIMAAFAGIYPRFGYCTRSAIMPGETAEILPLLREVMENREYRLERQEGDDLFWVKRSPFSRAVKFGQDRITCTRTATGYDFEGPSKEVVRIASAAAQRAS